MKETTCCFTGHRHLPADKIESIKGRLSDEIDNLIACGITDFMSGGALGFDQLAAAAVVAKKKLGFPVRLLLALPCKDQDALWPPEQQRVYRALLQEADDIHYVRESFARGCMKLRNQYMVEQSSWCVCALLRGRSGTSQTVGFAKKAGIRIINCV